MELLSDEISFLNDFTPVSLIEIESAVLLKRFDTKFIISQDKLPKLLKRFINQYRILEIDEKRVFRYSTTYYDTSDCEMYLKHHNKKLNRYKIRIRRYLDSDLCFIESKFKSNVGRVDKKRLELNSANDNSEIIEKFITEKTPYLPEDLEKQFNIEFSRFTLVNFDSNERVTIDYNLAYHMKGNKVKLNNLAVIEVKSKGQKTDFYRYMKSEGIFPFKISKYCLGQNILNSSFLKSNRFKKRNRQIIKLIQGMEEIFG